MFDEIDIHILEILQEKARIPNAEVARQVGMAPSAVLERIRKLEERGIIEGYEVRLNPACFHQGLSAFVQIETDGTDAQTATSLSAIPSVQEVHQVVGPDGFLVKLRTADHTTLAKILQQIRPLAGVKSMRTQVVLETVKETRRVDLTEHNGNGRH
ncbi:Lrp/AsnC family transcriptional regulator [Geomonas subterranea]|uniref:Lrp/AsnC family transcriptional regulator n=1 Tax=Geomonas subterranea TaxID=2847989 RepID=A0ABX8LLQ9_9BACT|nr:Lrp/AsnC family transcriptional regulator [Geomonas subterranea]QXE92612.1 Lrp/AsnC family transcriptional regulator [Geomonas subterranea]QXM09289.1 Lrp/AsnC family transcriptional regulator [Geomonas subterranea]